MMRFTLIAQLKLVKLKLVKNLCLVIMVNLIKLQNQLKNDAVLEKRSSRCVPLAFWWAESTCQFSPVYKHFFFLTAYLSRKRVIWYIAFVRTLYYLAVHFHFLAFVLHFANFPLPLSTFSFPSGMQNPNLTLFTKLPPSNSFKY